MSENVTHVAVCDDVARLAARHPAVPAAFKEVLQAHLDVSRLGAATRSADRWSAEIVAWARDHWPADATPASRHDAAGAAEPAEGPGVKASVPMKLAFVLGALTHRAADRLFKPIFEYCRQQDGAEAGLDCSIHCDVLVFNEVYGGGSGGAEPRQGATTLPMLPTSLLNPYQRAVFQAPTSEAGQQAERYLRVLWQRALIGMHTFSPDRDDMLGWLDRLFGALQPFGISLDHYQRVIDHPDPDKVRRYLDETHAYDRDDPLIRVARRIQAGEDVAGTAVAAALAATTADSSRYARALSKGVQYLLG
ncbi:MAG: hypothetical protein ACRDI2_06150, partial [Chloroflexota bacterium]